MRALVAAGVPQGRRGRCGGCWPAPPPARRPSPAPPTGPCRGLKARLASHQHAILIDLGRTFPAHPYFRGALGPGQLGLYNLLKA